MNKYQNIFFKKYHFKKLIQLTIWQFNWCLIFISLKKNDSILSLSQHLLWVLGYIFIQILSIIEYQISNDFQLIGVCTRMSMLI